MIVQWLIELGRMQYLIYTAKSRQSVTESVKETSDLMKDQTALIAYLKREVKYIIET